MGCSLATGEKFLRGIDTSDYRKGDCEMHWWSNLVFSSLFDLVTSKNHSAINILK